MIAYTHCVLIHVKQPFHPFRFRTTAVYIMHVTYPRRNRCSYGYIWIGRGVFFYVFFCCCCYVYIERRMIHELLVNSSMFCFFLLLFLFKKHTLIYTCVLHGPTKPRAGPAVYVGRQINHATRTDKLFGGRPAAILASCTRARAFGFFSVEWLYHCPA